MSKFLYGKGAANSWFTISQPKRPLGVLLRQSNGAYCVEPQDMEASLVQTVSKLGFQVALSIATETTEAIFDVISEEDHEIILGDGLHLQVVDCMNNLMRIGLSQARRFPYATLVRNERILLVWHDEADKVLQQAVTTEEKLMELVRLTTRTRGTCSTDSDYCRSGVLHLLQSPVTLHKLTVLMPLVYGIIQERRKQSKPQSKS